MNNKNIVFEIQSGGNELGCNQEPENCPHTRFSLLEGGAVCNHPDAPTCREPGQQLNTPRPRLRCIRASNDQPIS